MQLNKQEGKLVKGNENCEAAVIQCHAIRLTIMSNSAQTFVTANYVKIQYL